ncbi:hypothetical protein [Dietzia sp. ANT_WB102]|uniref:hypothetical protein n=1 Tax=Dietzia sp. ANT_WB102 TaxID=2597345 RepID=UPI0011F02A2F|nr:hypothetical protein [Dietzia sp. ANT_WB102]KAA0916441.1 hypothetical protein FQ137_14550 [Dietzia sp. ANT_WB102]
MTYLSRTEYQSMHWIQRYELTLNQLIMEQLEEVQEALLTRRGSLIDGAYAAYDQLNKFRREIMLGESHLPIEERRLIDDLVKVRMSSHPLEGGAADDLV